MKFTPKTFEPGEQPTIRDYREAIEEINRLLAQSNEVQTVAITMIERLGDKPEYRDLLCWLADAATGKIG